jgi:hypothetical protein
MIPKAVTEFDAAIRATQDGILLDYSIYMDIHTT